MNKLLKITITIVAAIVLIVTLYLGYAFATYYRLEDKIKLDINDNTSATINSLESHRIVSNNIGFGAYSDDFTFFMDGGKESWAFSKADVESNVTNQINLLKELNPEILLIQEVDFDSTRSYHVDERELIKKILSENNFDDVDSTFAQNYDSAFLFWPLYQPHGKSKAGIMTLSKYNITDSIRRSLPIEEGFSKFFDLDRCYSKNYIQTDNDKMLVVYNVHLSAYTTDPSTAINQVIMLNEDMLNEYNKGNYIIAGGDMNKDLLEDSSRFFNTNKKESNWASPFPVELLDKHFQLVSPIDESAPVPSCRDCDVPYDSNTFVITVDGFIVSDNVEVIDANAFDAQFKYSDHNPVYLDFNLK